MMKPALWFIVTFSLLLASASEVARSSGRVGRIYIVHGSDTSVRSGLDVSRFHITLGTSLYLDPNLAAQRVMSTSYRNQITDSYGHPLIMTWWMLCGSMFRYGTNANVPYANTLPLYLMQKHHGAAMQQFGDELTLHYHTWKWSDENGDGIWYWNQSRTFAELRDDFDFTLAQCLLEENMFPVSFRSGWHFMDNGWQQYLDQLLPYCMHNDSPHRGVDNVEPLDNNYDWSRGTLEWLPFHPSPDDYQVAGNCRGWNLRSAYMATVTRATLEQAFVRASQGENQVLCLWDHLADDTFFPSLERVNGLLHQLSAQYSGVTFEFKTAVEAMQLWRGTQDTTKPSLTLQETGPGSATRLRVQTSEPIFQKQPFVALKTRSEQFTVIQMDSVGANLWQSVQTFNADSVAKVACAVTDTAGNLAKAYIRHVPDDIFVDNSSNAYRELRGTWQSIATDTWGRDSRVALAQPNDSASVEWLPDIFESRLYKVFVQLPEVLDPARRLRLTIRSATGLAGVRSFSTPLPSNTWVYVGSFPLSEGASIQMTGFADSSDAMNLGADVVKISPLIQRQELYSSQQLLNFGYRSLNDTSRVTLFIENRGAEDQSIIGFRSRSFRVISEQPLPLVLPAATTIEMPVAFVFDHVAALKETLTILTDRTNLYIPVSGVVEYLVRIVDNEDAGAYFESGPWNTSVAVAYGRTSRFSFLNQGPGQFARFLTSVSQPGYYDVQQIVPASTNATNRALYTVMSNGNVLDSIYLDQRQPTTSWVSIGAFELPAGPVEVRVAYAGGSTAGDVLRADAVKLSWMETLPLQRNVIDNDSAGYAESGTWATSSGQAYGPSSRYSLITTTPGQYASFATWIYQPGMYEVRYIVPASANATNHALYTISVGGTVIDSMYLDQRVGGGTWVPLGRYNVPARRQIEVRVIHAGGNTEGNVLRADAAMLVPIPSSVQAQNQNLPDQYKLEQNYPNPFNPVTNFQFSIVNSQLTTLRLYDLLGREVATLVNEVKQPGIYTVQWTASAQGVASGVYLYRLQAGSFSDVKKMILLK